MSTYILVFFVCFGINFVYKATLNFNHMEDLKSLDTSYSISLLGISIPLGMEKCRSHKDVTNSFTFLEQELQNLSKVVKRFVHACLFSYSL